MKLFIHLLFPVLAIVILGWNGKNIIAEDTVVTNPNFDIFTIDSSPYGDPYSEWVAKWWTWWTAIPNDKHPVKDYSDSKRCSIM